ncbi:MAG TPA: 6-bladed beta-propeller [Gemmatimonadaceae bacterium]
MKSPVRCALLVVVGLTGLFLPRAGVAQLTVVETLRIGGPDDGPYLFSDIRGLAPGSNGSIFVLDYRTQEIRLFDSQGRFVKRVARRGNGPGEISNANGLLPAPNGEVWVNDPQNARWTVFSPAGEFVRQHIMLILSYGYIWDAMIDPSGVIYDPVSVPSAGGKYRNVVRRVRANGQVIDSLPARECEQRGTGDRPTVFEARSKTGSRVSDIPFLPSPVSAWDRRGFIWCSSRDRYEVIQIRAQRGDTVRRVTLDAAPFPVSKAERDSAVERIRTSFTKMGAPEPDYSRIPTVKPAIITIDVDDRGRLWVRRTTADSRRTTFDLWEERATRPVTVTAPWRLSRYFRPIFRGDTILTWALDEDDVPFVVRGVMKRSP